MGKCFFVRFLGSQNCLPEEKRALPKELLNGNLALKMTYQTRIWPSNILTRRDFFCPDNNSLSEILNIFKTNVCPCPWPDYNASASASGMSLSPQIVHIASQPCTHGP